MCLSYNDLNIKATGNCYLTHPNRNEDLDDVVLDAANQLELGKQDLIAWITSSSSWRFMKKAEQMELDVNDFSEELYKLCG